MDEVDIAQQETDRQLSTALNKRNQEKEARRMSPPVTDCIDCEGPIPEARQLAVPGCRRCIFCKEKFEQQQRRTKRGTNL